MKTRALTMACLIMPLMIYAQNHVQTFRGTVFEQETLMPLIGANVTIQNTDLGTSTDQDGQFIIPEVPTGRQTMVITYLGYEPVLISDVLITTGKELVLEIGMTESLVAMEEIVVKANTEKSIPSNEWQLRAPVLFRSKKQVDMPPVCLTRLVWP
ncbi:MAG: carboxypeptidase-like regulatory domain-containing protein [Saprospiraceae bacterium]|nr:carboxypeptidase-like regulatory domain-containing protein [Saprospiraceae bacterium]